MSPARTLPTRLLVQISVIPIPSEGIVEASCPHCGGVIQFHEPQATVPERLLGTCELCGSWTLYEEIAERGEALVIPLPRMGMGESREKPGPPMLKPDWPAHPASGFDQGESPSSGETTTVPGPESVAPALYAPSPATESHTPPLQGVLQASWVETLQPDWTGRTEGVTQWQRVLPVIPGWVEWDSPGDPHSSWREASGEFDLRRLAFNLDETAGSGEFDSWVGVL